MSKKVILFWNPFFVGPEFEGSHQLILTSASALVDLAFFLILELIEISHFFFIHLKTIVLLSLIRKKSSSFENYFLTDKFRLNFKFIHKQDFLPRYLKKWKIFFFRFFTVGAGNSEYFFHYNFFLHLLGYSWERFVKKYHQWGRR